MDKVLDKIVKQLEAVKRDVAALKEGKLGWRMGVVILGAVLTFFYAELKEVRDDLAVAQRTLDQILYIAKQNADSETLNAINSISNDASRDATSDASSQLTPATLASQQK